MNESLKKGVAKSAPYSIFSAVWDLNPRGQDANNAARNRDVSFSLPAVRSSLARCLINIQPVNEKREDMQIRLKETISRLDAIDSIVLNRRDREPRQV